MKKIKYFYNTNTLRYEKLETPLRVKLLRIFGFYRLFAGEFGIGNLVVYRFIPKPTDKVLQFRYDAMKDNYASLKEKTQTLERQIAELEKRDNEVYRSILKPTRCRIVPRAQLIEKKKELG